MGTNHSSTPLQKTRYALPYPPFTIPVWQLTCPVPLQYGQVCSLVPGSPPEPKHLSQDACTRRDTSFSQPLTASLKLRFKTSRRESPPNSCSNIEPNPPTPPPKNCLNISSAWSIVKGAPPPGAPPPGMPWLVYWEWPVASYIWRLFLSLSTYKEYILNSVSPKQSAYIPLCPGLPTFFNAARENWRDLPNSFCT